LTRPTDIPKNELSLALGKSSEKKRVKNAYQAMNGEQKYEVSEYALRT
jgi:hypothetical protein